VRLLNARCKPQAARSHQAATRGEGTPHPHQPLCAPTPHSRRAEQAERARQLQGQVRVGGGWACALGCWPRLSAPLLCYPHHHPRCTLVYAQKPHPFMECSEHAPSPRTPLPPPCRLPPPPPSHTYRPPLVIIPCRWTEPELLQEAAADFERQLEALRAVARQRQAAC